MTDEKTYPIMDNIEITVSGITKLLQNLNPSKACGPDQIKPRVLKELATSISPILCLIYQKSIDTGEVPTDWKTAHVTPIYKKGAINTTQKTTDPYL